MSICTHVFFPLWKNIAASGAMGSCCWLVLSLIHVVAGNSREQISLGALYIHCAQETGKAAEPINKKKMSCSTVSSQDMEGDTS